MKQEDLIIYRDFEDGQILSDMIRLTEHYRSGDNTARPAFYECMHKLLEMAALYGFQGNLWHCYLTNLLVGNENSYRAASTSWHCTISLSSRNILITILRR